MYNKEVLLSLTAEEMWVALSNNIVSEEIFLEWIKHREAVAVKAKLEELKRHLDMERW